MLALAVAVVVVAALLTVRRRRSSGGAPGGAAGRGAPGAARPAAVRGPGGAGLVLLPAAVGAPGDAPGAARGGAAGAAGGAAPQPIVLSRNGKDYTVTNGNVRAGTEIKVTTEMPSVSLRVVGDGQRLVGDSPAAGLQHRSLGYAADQLDALRTASDTSYFKDKDALWVKVVSP